MAKKFDASKIIKQDDEIPSIKAPFTDDQVNSLNAYQKSKNHPYTCGGKHCREILVATNDGWICENCGYMQESAHLCSADWSWKKYEPKSP